ncbi:T-cell immunoglobulin and mucin domain-containing protein 4, partial [Acanthisitta chloris]
HAASQTVVTGVTGRSVTLPCHYKVTQAKDISDMCWGRGPCPNSKCDKKILHTSGRRVAFRTSGRYNLQGYISHGDVSLTIRAVDEKDAGVYCCRVEIPGWFNDIKRNIRLEVTRAPPVMTTTTRKVPVSPKHFRKTTFAPQATSDLQPTTESDVLLTTTTAIATTAAESTAVTTLETIAPPTLAVTENDIFPVTVVTSSAPPDFPTSSQAVDVRTEDDMFCCTEFVPSLGSTEVTTEFPTTLMTAEGTKNAHTSVMVEDVPTTDPKPVSIPSSLDTPEKTNPLTHLSQVNMFLKPFQLFSSPFQFLSSAILIACLTAGSILVILMVSLFWKRKHTKKLKIKSLAQPEEPKKVFSGAEGENNIFSL